MRSRRKSISSRRPDLRVGVATLAYAVVYVALGADRYAGHRSGADLGLFVQSCVSPGFANTLEGGSHFTYHFSPILIVLAPLVRLTHSALALVAVQALAGALVIPGVYLLARRHLEERTSVLLAISAAVYPPLAGVTFTDFHENGLTPAAIVWLVWAVDARRWPLAAAFAAVALAIKEDEALVLAACGVLACVWFARRGEGAGARFSAAAAVVAVAVFAAYFGVVRPLAGAHDAWNPQHFYAWDRNGPGTAGLNPLGRITYLLEAFAPLAFGALASPFVVFALPGIAECLLSHLSITYTMGQHYAGVWIGWILAAQVFGMAAVARRDPRRARIWTRTAIGVSLAILIVASPTHWGHFLGPVDADDRALDRLASLAPLDASIASYDEMYAHLGLHPRAQIGLAGDPQYVIDDVRHGSPTWVERWRPQLVRDVGAGRYRAVARAAGATLYRREPARS